jgi:hypothetical protein
MGVWAFFDFCLLGTGIVSLVLSIVWRAPDLLMNMIFGAHELTAGTVLGISLLVTFAFSIGAIVQRNHVTIGLVILNWLLIVDSIGVLLLATVIWFFTLRERDNLHAVYTTLSPENRITLQDKFRCCGYFNSSDLIEFGGSFCKDSSFIQSPAFLGNDSGISFACVGPIPSAADQLMNHVFTTTYGFMAVIVGLFLTSLCVISKRLEDERFKKIDLKRGGKSFV